MTVERVRVGDVLSLQRRGVSVEPEGEYEEIGVRSFGRGIFHKEPVPGADLGTKRVFWIEPSDLVISNVFAWEGAIAVASQAETGRIGSHRFMTFVPTDGRIDTSWASWYLRSEGGLDLIRQASPGSAGRNRTLAIDRFEALEIPLPSIDEQRRVAKRLDRLEAAASELRHHTDHASELMGALAVSASARPDLNGRAKAREGWCRVALAKVLELNNHEVQVHSGTSYDIAGVYSFGRGMFGRATLDGSQTSYKALHQLQSGQLVMSRLKAWEGALALVPGNLEGWFVSPEFPVFDIDSEQVDAQFLGAVLTSERFWSQLKGASQGIGARRERVKASRLLEQEVEFPPLEEQRSVARLIQRVQAFQMRREQAAERIDALVPAALNQAFASLS